jgi:hypothetical protein
LQTCRPTNGSGRRRLNRRRHPEPGSVHHRRFAQGQAAHHAAKLVTPTNPATCVS